MRFRELRTARFGDVPPEGILWLKHGGAACMADLSGPMRKMRRALEEDGELYYMAVSAENFAYPICNNDTVYVPKKA